MATSKLEPTEDEQAGEVREVSAEEAWALFDQEVRRRLHMSAEEFIEKLDAGFWPDPDASASVMHLAVLREFTE